MQRAADRRRHLAFAVPGDLSTPTGGYAYDRRMIAELRACGWHVEIVQLGDGFPFPSCAQRVAAVARLSALPESCIVVVDGLAFGTMPELACLNDRTPLVALVHMPLAFDPALRPFQAAHFRESERRALSAATGVIVTSGAMARVLVADYAVPPARLGVVKPGNDKVPATQGSSNDLVRLLAVGSVVPVKGYDVLIEAVARLSDSAWRLDIVGERSRDHQTAMRIERAIMAHGLSERVTLVGALSPEDVAGRYMTSDVFVQASRFEAYGMALTEAIAHGLPVVATAAGAIPETVPAGAGLLVPPGDAAALARALRFLIGNPDDRARLGARARFAAARFPTWRESALVFSGLLEGIVADPVPHRAFAR